MRKSKGARVSYTPVTFQGYALAQTRPAELHPFRFGMNHDGKPVMQIEFPNGWTVSIIQTIGMAFYDVGRWHEDGRKRHWSDYQSDQGSDEVAAFIALTAKRR